MDKKKNGLDEITAALTGEQENDTFRKSLRAIISTIIQEQEKAGVDVSEQAYIDGLKNTIAQLIGPTRDQELFITVLHLYLDGNSNSLLTLYKILAYNGLTDDDTDYNLVRRRSFFHEYPPDLLLEMIDKTYELLVKDIERLEIKPDKAKIFFLIALSINNQIATAICFAEETAIIPGSLVDIHDPSTLEPVTLTLVNQHGYEKNIKQRALWFFTNEEKMPMTEEISALLNRQRHP